MVEPATLVVSAGVSSEVAPLLVAHLVAGGPQSMIDTIMIQGKELIFVEEYLSLTDPNTSLEDT